MNAVAAGLANSKTTTIGALLGAGTYLNQVGFQVPHTGDQWIGFGVSILFAVLGLLAKDASTGSLPS